MNRRVTLAALAGAFALPRVARAADPMTLQMGTMPTDASGQAYYGLDRNFFRDGGFDVKLTTMNNTSVITSAVAGGTLDVGFGSVIPLAQAHLHGLDFRVIAPAMIYNGSAPVNVIMAAKNSNVKTGADLNGATVAVNGLRDLTQFTMQAWIDKNGGDAKTVKIIEMPFSEMGVALESGRVAAGILAEPFWSATLPQARVIGNGSAAVANRYMVTCWFASSAWLAANAEKAKRLQAVLLHIARWANANHADSAAILTKYARITPEVAARMQRAVIGDTKPDPAMLAPVIDVAVKYGGMQSLPAADLIWTG
jgi:NitT/TauT family transport system substrate-binding protein